MKVWMKIVIVAISGAVVWGLSYIGTLESMSTYAMALSLASGAVASACTALTGFTKTT